MLWAVLKRGVSDHVSQTFGDLQQHELHRTKAVIAGCGKYFTSVKYYNYSAVYNILSAILLIFNGSLLFDLLEND